jgi:oligosaccharide repeat unit polymerase
MVVAAAIIVLGVIGLILRSQQGSWSAPTPLLVGYWVFALALPSIAGYSSSIGAILIISFLLVAWSTGGLISSASPIKPSSTRVLAKVTLDPKMWHRKALGVVMVAGGASATTAAYVSIHNAGYHISEVLSLGGLFQVGNGVSIQRYSPLSPHASPTISALLMITYLGALSAPRWLFCIERSWYSKLLSGIPILGATLYGVTSTARAAMIVAWALWAGSYLTCRALIGSPVRLKLTTITRITISFAIGTALFLAIGYIRIGGPTAHGSQKVAGKVESYAFGYLPAFSDWAGSLYSPSYNFAPESRTWGDLTFNGISKFFTHNSTDSRPYAEFVAVDSQGDLTNIYTFFRGLIQDFGLIGAAEFMLITGCIAQHCYRKMQLLHTVGSYVTTTAITSTILLTATFSPFFFTNVCIAFCVDIAIVRTTMKTHSSHRAFDKLVDPTVRTNTWQTS